MVVIQITHIIKPERVDDYLVATQALAHETRREPDNVRFDVLRDASDPRSFQLYEVYVDREAQQAHLASAHFLAWKSAVQDVFADRAIRRFEPVHIA